MLNLLIQKFQFKMFFVFRYFMFSVGNELFSCSFVHAEFFFGFCGVRWMQLTVAVLPAEALRAG